MGVAVADKENIMKSILTTFEENLLQWRRMMMMMKVWSLR